MLVRLAKYFGEQFSQAEYQIFKTSSGTSFWVSYQNYGSRVSYSYKEFVTSMKQGNCVFKSVQDFVEAVSIAEDNLPRGCMYFSVVSDLEESNDM